MMQLSGNSYVAAVMKGEEYARPTPKILTANERRCDHTERICTKCAHEWAHDWILLWERTAGGRALKAKIDKENTPQG